MKTIEIVLQQAVYELVDVSNTARLDAEVLLAHCLNKPRSFLYTWPEEIILNDIYQNFVSLVKRRKQLEPIAYLIGHCEFWSLDFMVNDAVLIPRPETEMLVELTLDVLSNYKQADILELGTGSGAIAIALAKEKPQWYINATDLHESALTIARDNARCLQVNNIAFYLSNWFSDVPNKRFHVIISNPPYIAEDDPHLHRTSISYEPKAALAAADVGFAALKEIIVNAGKYLLDRGWLLLEHGYQQGAATRELLQFAGFQNIVTYQDLANLDRVTVGQLPVEK